MANGTGPKGQHGSLDSYETATPAQPPSGVSGYLIPPPKKINPADKQVGPPKGSSGQINPDTFSERG